MPCSSIEQCTLVLIPGLLSDERVWASLESAVQDTMPVYRADLTKGSSISGWAESVLTAVPGQLIAVGHSMGGRVALEMARLAPDRLQGLVLADTGYDGVREDEDPRRQAMIDLGHESMHRLADRWLPPMLTAQHRVNTALVNDLRAMVLRAGAELHERQISALLTRPDAGSYLSSISCPTLFLVGRYDEWSPIAQHEEMAGSVRDSQLVVIDDAGHFAPVEEPGAVTTAIVDWLGDRFQTGSPSP